MGKITAVLAVYNNLKLTKEFLTLFRQDHPDIPLAVGALGAEPDLVQFLREYELIDPNVTVVYGNRPEGICFSENFNAAINLVQTEYLVLIHNDMVISKVFFKNLLRNLEEVGNNFILYNTLEPLYCQGHMRPGKYLYGESEEFRTLTDAYNSKFEEYWPTLNLPNTAFKMVYGFFMAGRLSSFKDVGGFDHTRYKPCFAEDDDFSVRLKIKGYNVYLSSDCFVYHLSAKTSNSFKKQGQERASLCEFVRKWGFDPKFLCGTGFEHQQQLFLKDFHTQFVVTSQQDLNLIPVIEPSMSSIVGSTEELTDKISQILQTLEPNKSWLNTKVKFDESLVDIRILVQDRNSLDCSSLLKILFQLRFNLKPLKLGRYLVGGFILEIKNSLEFNPLMNDFENYLLKQSQLHYEQ